MRICGGAAFYCGDRSTMLLLPFMLNNNIHRFQVFLLHGPSDTNGCLLLNSQGSAIVVLTDSAGLE
jgi:hypothetical protein